MVPVAVIVAVVENEGVAEEDRVGEGVTLGEGEGDGDELGIAAL